MSTKEQIGDIESEAALYALGALPERDAAKFRQRLAAGCSLCRGLLHESEQVVNLLTLAAPEIEPPAGIRSRLLDCIGAEAHQSGELAEGTLLRAGETEWEDAPVPGVHYRKLHGSKTMLVRMDPKSALPPHDHKSAEQCLVLEGSIISEGVTAYAGDYVFMPAGSIHSSVYSETGALFLIAYS